MIPLSINITLLLVYNGLKSDLGPTFKNNQNNIDFNE